KVLLEQGPDISDWLDDFAFNSSKVLLEQGRIFPQFSYKDVRELEIYKVFPKGLVIRPLDVFI
ncbi:MAG: hypothetical protein J7J05_05310, partial [Thermococcus sp.]|uniref:hypothetical protein n=1 Tax=Thermococcus sp. TaxID=35749 RepID=UPI00260EAAAB